MKTTNAEKEMLKKLSFKIKDLQDYCKNDKFDEQLSDYKQWYNYFVNIKKIIGNLDNDISYIACLLAKEFLLSNHSIESFDVSLKKQSAPGLDIDEKTTNGERIIAEIKTTIPYLIEDLGAQQRNSFLKDFRKLNKNDAEFKYFMVTEENTFNVVKCRYEKYLDNKTLVLLPNALFDESYIIKYDENMKKDNVPSSLNNSSIQSDFNIKRESLADQIREFIYKNYIMPAKNSSNKEIKIKSADVRKDMKLKGNRYPTVCSAMRGNKIKDKYSIEIIKTKGKDGANFYVTYKI